MIDSFLFAVINHGGKTVFIEIRIWRSVTFPFYGTLSNFVSNSLSSHISRSWCCRSGVSNILTTRGETQDIYRGLAWRTHRQTSRSATLNLRNSCNICTAYTPPPQKNVYISQKFRHGQHAGFQQTFCKLFPPSTKLFNTGINTSQIRIL